MTDTTNTTNTTNADFADAYNIFPPRGRKTSKATNITIVCGVCSLSDTFSYADHRCETCGFDVCTSCAGAGYELDHARIDRASSLA